MKQGRKPNDKVMSKVQIFELVTWLKAEALDDGVVNGSLPQIAKRAAEELKFTVSCHTTRACMEEMGLVTTKAVKGATEVETEILRRLRMLEKFVTKYFPDDWAELWKEE